MNHWRDDPRGVFELARQAHTPPCGAKERGRKRLDARLAALAATGVGVSSAKAALLVFSGSKGPLITVFFMGAAAAGYAGGKVIAQNRVAHVSDASVRAGPAARAAASARPVVSTPKAQAELETRPVSVTSSSNALAESRRSSDVSRATPAEPAPTTKAVFESPTRLTEEAALIRRANQALGSGDAAQAMTILAEHAHEFPAGALTEERVAAQIMAACQLGRAAEARAQFDAFIEKWPRSPHRTRVRSACRWP